MNPAQLSAWFAQNKVAVLGVAGAGAVLLGLRARRKPAAAVTSRPPGTLPAAAVVPANGLQSQGPDNTAVQVYDALQSELAPFLQQQAAQTSASSGISSVPAVASTLFSPAGSGSYVHFGNGTVAEVESDGSLYGLSFPEWSQLVASKGAKFQDVAGPDLARYTRATNLATVNKPPAS